MVADSTSVREIEVVNFQADYVNYCEDHLVPVDKNSTISFNVEDG